jgi:hypothetical protein
MIIIKKLGFLPVMGILTFFCFYVFMVSVDYRNTFYYAKHTCLDNSKVMRGDSLLTGVYTPTGETVEAKWGDNLNDPICYYRSKDDKQVFFSSRYETADVVRFFLVYLFFGFLWLVLFFCLILAWQKRKRIIQEAPATLRRLFSVRMLLRIALILGICLMFVYLAKQFLVTR